MTPSWYDIKKEGTCKDLESTATAIFSVFILTESPSFKATTKRSTQGKFKDP